MSENIIEEVVKASPNRRKFLKTLGAATAAVTAMGVATPSADAQSSTDLSVLNFFFKIDKV